MTTTLPPLPEAASIGGHPGYTPDQTRAYGAACAAAAVLAERYACENECYAVARLSLNTIDAETSAYNCADAIRARKDIE